MLFCVLEKFANVIASEDTGLKTGLKLGVKIDGDGENGETTDGDDIEDTHGGLASDRGRRAGERRWRREKESRRVGRGHRWAGRDDRIAGRRRTGSGTRTGLWVSLAIRAGRGPGSTFGQRTRVHCGPVRSAARPCASTLFAESLARRTQRRRRRGRGGAGRARARRRRRADDVAGRLPRQGQRRAARAGGRDRRAFT